MCRADIAESASAALGQLLADMAAALCPADPDSVLIGPVDFGDPEPPDHPPISWCRIFAVGPPCARLCEDCTRTAQAQRRAQEASGG